MSASSSLRAGVVLAAIAAVAFGLTTPIVAWAGQGLGPLATASLLYLGAAVAAAVLRIVRGHAEAPLRRADLGRVVAVALVGGALAPTLLAWGLQRAGATVGSLLLNLEAVFTVLLAWVWFREPIGPRVALALLAMLGGGAALTAEAWGATRWGLAGILAVAGATAAWAVDNTLTRPLAERDPLEVVASKGGLGALVTAITAVLAGEAWPSPTAATVLLLCGATGYGLSLRLYLLAQRRIGAGRTGSVFALAPFIGAAVATALGNRTGGEWTAVAAVLFALGVYLHLTERHAHPHQHPALAHDHLHRHLDPHHAHTHDPPFVGEHAHPHQHDALAHDHEHAPDVHHDHH
ncbi:MAG: EamA family transporter [Kofleriaceae bacterium]|nr:EamA family transporter [Kofleriaceae bacterium]MBP6835931.1 EamA family transporter [Kofleriaceae bacterium]MBP9203026.1 EamA family transporter [Kofleriaceae bacterium]